MCVRLLAQSNPTLCDPMERSPPGFSVHGNFPGKDTGVGCHFLLQGIFPTQESNPHFSCTAGGFFTRVAIRGSPIVSQQFANVIPQSSSLWDRIKISVRIALHFERERERERETRHTHVQLWSSVWVSPQLEREFSEDRYFCYTLKSYNCSCHKEALLDIC